MLGLCYELSYESQYVKYLRLHELKNQLVCDRNILQRAVTEDMQLYLC